MTSFCKLSLAVAALLVIAACNASQDTTGQDRVYSRSSQYDPMDDAASGDGRPSVPSINSITPQDALGNSNADIVVPNNNMGIGGRR